MQKTRETPLCIGLADALAHQKTSHLSHAEGSRKKEKVLTCGPVVFVGYEVEKMTWRTNCAVNSCLIFNICKDLQVYKVGIFDIVFRKETENDITTFRILQMYGSAVSYR